MKPALLIDSIDQPSLNLLLSDERFRMLPLDVISQLIQKFDIFEGEFRVDISGLVCLCKITYLLSGEQAKVIDDAILSRLEYGEQLQKNYNHL